MNRKQLIFRCIVSVILCMTTLFMFCLTGCRERYRVNYNLSREADNFKIQRRVIVWNSRTDSILFSMEGNIALTNNDTNELVITCKTSEDTYQKHYIYLNEYTLYVVEDIGENSVDPYHYEFNINPKMIGGVSITVGE